MSFTNETAIDQAKSTSNFGAATDHPSTSLPRRARARDEVLEHYLRRVDPAVAASFTKPQRDAIRSILSARGMTKHAIEIRHSFPVSKWRFYAVLLMGKEQRTLHRRGGESVVSRPLNLLVYACLAALLSAPVLGVILALGL